MNKSRLRPTATAAGLMRLMRRRHSWRVAFDPRRPVDKKVMRRILMAAAWAPTAHNLQNYEVIVVQRKDVMGKVTAAAAPRSIDFLEDNFQLLSFSPAELKKRKIGLPASLFPPEWRDQTFFESNPLTALAKGPRWVSDLLRGCRTLVLVVYDATRQPPGSTSDELQLISLGCVLQNLWLMAEQLGVGVQVLSAFTAPELQSHLRDVLHLPGTYQVGFAARLGYPVSKSAARPKRGSRVRRDPDDFCHYDRYR